jgi:Ca2+-binding EF-hand superfamily protein
MSVIIGCH